MYKRVGLLFFLSGAAALIYQVAWQRLLALLSGSSSTSIAVIVAAFMAGLGVGSEWGGRRSVGLTPARALKLFAFLELALSAFALASPWLFHDLLHERLGGLYASPWLAGTLHALTLLPPTALMGMSLPFLTRAMVRDRDGAPRTIGFLYAINVAGAALGALMTPWVLIRFLGVDGAIWVAAGLNATAGLGALELLRVLPAATDVGAPTASAAPREEPSGERPFRLFLMLYALSGFCALALEILWFRVIEVGVRSSAFSFGTVLALYLAGLATGGFAGTAFAHRVRRPLVAFLTCQSLVMLYAGLAVVALARLPSELPPLAWLTRYWTGEFGSFVFGRELELETILRLYGLFPIALFGPATALMGLSFPILQRAVQDEPRLAGARVGALQAANILGCVAGSLLVGLVALERFGSAGTLLGLMLVGLLFPLVGALAGSWRRFVPLAAAIGVVSFLLPDQQGLWGRLHGARDHKMLLGEDATGLSAFVRQSAHSWQMIVNGHNHSWIPYQGIHTLLGAIPSLVHPAPRSVAVIGLGSGDTAWAAGCRAETDSVVVFEIIGPQLHLLRELTRLRPYRETQAFLRDPRVVVKVQDGRYALRHDERRYDVIEMDALEPYRGMSGNIYSEEFFRLCASRLEPGGVFCAWTPTERIRRSVHAAFPFVLDIRAGRQPVALASRERLAFTPALWRERLERRSDYFGPRLTQTVRESLDTLEPRLPPSAGLGNTDLHPRDELASP